MSRTVHATTVAIRGRGVMLLGASGAGKSDLALRLIDRGAELVADDYTVLTLADGALIASPPTTIAGRIEVRGVGIVTWPFRDRVHVALAVRLGAEERMPDTRTTCLAGIDLPEITIDPFPASAALKVELAMERLTA